MSTEKSVVVSSFGDCEALSIMCFPLPLLDEHFVEVEVHFCGVNFADLYTIKGFGRQQVPFVLGIECCGIVKARGSRVNNIQVKQRVVCYDFTGGMCSDRIRLPSNKCYPIPDDIPFHIACAMFVGYLTAYYGLIKLGHVKDYDTILIKSCAGNVGWAATQLSKLRKNVHICGTVSEGKEEFVRENGVNVILDLNDENIDYKFDVILNNEAGESIQQAIGLLNNMGRLILLGANNFIEPNPKPVDDALLKKCGSGSCDLLPIMMKSASVSGLHLGMLAQERHGDVLKSWTALIDLYRTGAIKPRIDSIFAIDEVVDAVIKLRDRKNVGKVLLSFNR